MKIRIKRMICLLTALCLIIAAVPVVAGITARAADPELSAMCENLIDINGKDTDFGTSSSSLRINTRIVFDEARDFSAFDTIKFDVYVQSYTALKGFISDTQRLLLCFGSQKANNKEKTKRFTADISTKITKSGWNAVTVDISDFSGEGTWSSIWRINLAFSNEDIASLPNDLKNTAVKYKNICDVFSAPAVTDSGTVLFGGSEINTLGETSTSLLENTADRFAAQFETADISDFDIIKVDK